MKEFNLEDAKAGKPVCTKDGRDARIVCFDVKSSEGSDFELLALVMDDLSEEESSEFYTKEGRYYDNEEDSNYDLMMKSITRSGWINVYEDMVFQSEEAARAHNIGSVPTIKVEWEEDV